MDRWTERKEDAGNKNTPKINTGGRNHVCQTRTQNAMEYVL